MTSTQGLCPADVEHIDHRETRFAIEPFETWARLRDTKPVAYSDVYGGFWIVTGYEQAYEVMRDHETYCSSQGIEHPRNPELPNIVLIETDPPQHRDYRNILNPSFSPRQADVREPELRTLVTELIDGFIERGTADLVDELARPLPRIVLFRLLGIPDGITEHAAGLLHTATRGVRDDPEGAQRAGIAFYRLLTELVAEQHNRPPGDDVLSTLLGGIVDGRPVTDDEIARLLIVVLGGGMNTVKSQIAGTLLYLIEHPEVRQRLIDEPELMQGAVEEFLRHVSPIHGLIRTATRDTVLGGVPIAEGDKVYVVLASANRDESEFPGGEGCVLDRKPNRHIAFGLGNHRCIGSHLARHEFRIALEEVLRRLPDFRLVADAEITWDVGSVTRGVESLPVEFTPGPRSSSAEIS
ncbi:MAG TPA: cytochrome P450 [Pseudonocardia sp.]|jgi:cytochrome P450|nr:cytochrome P450 [Pseudonocardia sp.]